MTFSTQIYNTGELGYDEPLYDGFLHMTDDMLGLSPMHIEYSSYVYNGFCIWRTNFPGPIESLICKFICSTAESIVRKYIFSPSYVTKLVKIVPLVLNILLLQISTKYSWLFFCGHGEDYWVSLRYCPNFLLTEFFSLDFHGNPSICLSNKLGIAWYNPHPIL